MAMVAAADRLQGQVRNPVVLAHLLSLDAPLVAAVWLGFVARCFHVELATPAPVAMFLAVWILYAGDRLLDARLGQEEGLEARHRFHWAHRRAFVAGIFVAFTVLVAVLPHARLMRPEACAGAALVVWLGIVHRRAHGPMPKELAVGVFFSAAVILPCAAAGLKVLEAGLCFMLVCVLNGLYIHRWEHPGASLRDTHRWTLAALAQLRLLTVAAMVAPLALLPLLSRDAAPVLLACSAAATLLAGMDELRRYVRPAMLRAVVDLALLTPLLLLPMVR